MKKLTLLLSLFIVMSAVAAEHPRHIISVGTQGFGWSGMGEIFEWDEDESGIEDNNEGTGRFSLNYNYVFPGTKVMLGAEIDYTGSRSKTETVGGIKTETESMDTFLGLSVGYNFSDNFNEAWWLRLTAGGGLEKEETKVTGVAKREEEISRGSVGLTVGKRFGLSSWGLENVTYSPSFTVAGTRYGKDAEDQGLDSSQSARIDFVKIDILF